MRYFYALSDIFAGNDPSEPTYGFANTSCPIAFKSKKERDTWIKETNLLKARPLTRKEVLKMTAWMGGYHISREWDWQKIVALYGTDDYIAVASKNN